MAHTTARPRSLFPRRATSVAHAQPSPLPAVSSKRLLASQIPGLSTTHQHLKSFPLYIMPYDQTELGLHSHDFTELVYVRHGFGSHLHGGQEYPIHRGDCFVIPPGDLHGYANVRDLRIVNILFYPRLLAEHLRSLWDVDGFKQLFSMEPAVRSTTQFKYKLHLQAHQDAAVSSVVAEMIDEQQSGKPGSSVVCTGLFYKLVVYLSRCFEENLDTDAVESAMGAPHDGVARAISFLESSYDKDLTLEEVASHACMSPSHLSHVFKKSIGMGLFDYLLAFRINKARYLLYKTKDPVTQVALATGFNDPAYFSRAFRKAVGQSPLQFRKSALHLG